MAFRVRKVFETLEKRAPGLSCSEEESTISRADPGRMNKVAGEPSFWPFFFKSIEFFLVDK